MHEPSRFFSRATAALALALAAGAIAAPGCTGRPLVPIDADPSATGVWQFTQSRPATILFVIDNSPSMGEEQANLRANMAEFIDTFRAAAPDARFHMGVVTTDLEYTGARAGHLHNEPTGDLGGLDCTTGLPSPLPKWVDETTPEIERVFRCLASVGTAGYGGETALGAARMALGPELLNDPAANGGFYIPGSLLMVVFLGDEDDCSVCSGNACAALDELSPTNQLACSIGPGVDELAPVADFVQFMKTLPDGRGGLLGDDGIVVASIIGLDASGGSTGPIEANAAGTELLPICTTPEQGSAVPSPRLQAFTRAFATSYELSICDADYGSELEVLAREFGSRVRGGCLPHPPCPGSTAADIVIRVREAADGKEAVRYLNAGSDYDVVCATPMDACGASSDATCADGWRVSFAGDLPAGAEVEVVYAIDAGDACNSF